MAQKVWSAPEKRDPILAAIPFNRIAELADLVEPILFPLSDGAGMIRGVCLPIDEVYGEVVSGLSTWGEALFRA